jgi:glycosyltransferase involved in cell wall biosynthesis
MRMAASIRLSVILPVYYNAGSLEAVVDELESTVGTRLSTSEYELVFVDDGSPDDSLTILRRLAETRPHLRIVKLTRNFGQVPAILAGLSQARGEYAATCSADGQDPATLMVDMFDKAVAERRHVVVGIRETRGEPLSTRLVGLAFSLVMRRLALRDYPVGGFDCVLLSRRCYGDLTRRPEKSPFLQGLVLWMGYPHATVPYHRRARLEGRSRWSLGRKLTYLWDGLIGYSFAPIQVMSLLGLCSAALGLLYAVVVLVARVVFHATPVGWAPLMVVILVTSGVQMMMMSIIGQYLRRNYDEARPRPLFLIDEILPPETDRSGPPPAEQA